MTTNQQKLPIKCETDKCSNSAEIELRRTTRSTKEYVCEKCWKKMVEQRDLIVFWVKL